VKSRDKLLYVLIERAKGRTEGRLIEVVRELAEEKVELFKEVID
jgi:hypothetical protein